MWFSFSGVVSVRRSTPLPAAGVRRKNGRLFIVKESHRPSPAYVYFSNRPFWVKRFQTIHHYSVDVARGLALLFGIGTEALPAWDSKTRWNNL
jgi:hypothetical protein